MLRDIPVAAQHTLRDAAYHAVESSIVPMTKLLGLPSCIVSCHDSCADVGVGGNNTILGFTIDSILKARFAKIMNTGSLACLRF